MPKVVFLHHCYMVLGSRSRSNFWHAVVDIRNLTLPSAAKRNNHHYQSEVIVCRNQWTYANNCVDAVDRLLITYSLSCGIIDTIKGV